MGDLPYVEWLARKYMEKGEISRCWSDYLKVNLYQLIIVLGGDKVKTVITLLKCLYVNRTTVEESDVSVRGSRGFKVNVLIDRREIIDTKRYIGYHQSFSGHIGYSWMICGKS